MLDRWFAGKQDWAVLLLRLAMGIIFFAHGAQKVFGWFGGYGWSATMRAFTQGLGIPMPLAAAAALAELVGGILLILGLATRWAGLVLAFEMLVAAIKVHWANGFFLNMSNAPGKGSGIEYNLILIASGLALMILGGGRYSVDAALERPAGWDTGERAAPRRAA